MPVGNAIAGVLDIVVAGVQRPALVGVDQIGKIPRSHCWQSVELDLLGARMACLATRGQHEEPRGGLGMAVRSQGVLAESEPEHREYSLGSGSLDGCFVAEPHTRPEAEGIRAGLHVQLPADTRSLCRESAHKSLGRSCVDSGVEGCMNRIDLAAHNFVELELGMAMVRVCCCCCCSLVQTACGRRRWELLASSNLGLVQVRMLYSGHLLVWPAANCTYSIHSNRNLESKLGLVCGHLEHP